MSKVFMVIPEAREVLVKLNEAILFIKGNNELWISLKVRDREGALKLATEFQEKAKDLKERIEKLPKDQLAWVEREHKAWLIREKILDKKDIQDKLIENKS